MKLYVAGRFQSYEKVRAVIDRCKDAGHEITYDWTRTTEFDENGKARVEGSSGALSLPLEERQKYAYNDLQGVKDADAVVLCADDSLAGAWIEVGAALIDGKPILAIKPERYTIFLDCQEVTQIDSYDDLERALAHIEDNVLAAV